VQFEIIELPALSGNKTKIYSVYIENEQLTLYEQFIQANQHNFEKEVVNIDERLEMVGNDYGLIQEYFDTGSGRFGQNLCTFKDRPGSHLRLYFIEFGFKTIILGSGGEKPKDKRTSQEVPILDRERNLIGLVSETLQKAERAGEFGINEDGSIWSTTNFKYDKNDYE